MIGIYCVDCASLDDADHSYTNYRCKRCNGILEASALVKNPVVDEAHQSMWRYREWLPLAAEAQVVSLGEGSTPLLRCAELDELVSGTPRIWVKDETTNPSGSFKDRFASVAVSQALTSGATTICCASSGNAAASTAAYASRAGLEAVVFIPESTPLAKVRQALALGAQVVLVPGDYSDSYAVCDRVARAQGWPNITTTYLNPFGTAGLATVGLEIAEHAAFARAHPVVSIPIGAGPLLYGIHRGWAAFDPSRQAAPLLGVQASGCSPIVRAFDRGDDTVREWGTPATIASGISDPLRGYPEDGTLTLRLIRESEGAAIAVEDDEIRHAQIALATRVGLLAEPTGAAAFAGVIARGRKQEFSDDCDVVVVLTGHGFKQPQEMPAGTAAMPMSVDEVRRIIAGADAGGLVAELSEASESTRSERKVG